MPKGEAFVSPVESVIMEVFDGTSKIGVDGRLPEALRTSAAGVTNVTTPTRSRIWVNWWRLQFRVPKKLSTAAPDGDREIEPYPPFGEE
jgi:hypothetical protein